MRFFGTDRTAVHPFTGTVPASVLRYTKGSGKAQVLYLHGVLWYRQDSGTPVYRYCTSMRFFGTRRTVVQYSHRY